MFYVAANHELVSVPVEATDTLKAGRPAKLFDTLVDTTLGPSGRSTTQRPPMGRGSS